jgi:UDP-glucose 4-epimerase
VGESVEKPAVYFENNVEQGVTLLRALLDAGATQFIFSSTCATYGEPDEMPIRENTPQWPRNPYGWSKLIMERLLDSYDHAYAFKFMALRYFNAAGATAKHGDHHEPESHLVPNILAACSGRKSEVSVFGTDYPTPDGTAIRDYIHVVDLADAHIRSLNYLRKGGNSEFINLGTGVGSSILEVIESARQVTGRDVKVRIEPRRPGDPAKLVADATKAAEALNWQPIGSDVPAILLSQWQWNVSHPQGYGS